MNDLLLHPLPAEASEFDAPKLMTYPFCYEPHAWCRLAAKEVMAEVERHADWHEEIMRDGKMLGVLVVEGGKFLAAFSGTLTRKSTLPYFVPPVFELHGTYFQEEESRISALPVGPERKQRSQDLQQWLFRQFTFLNALGEKRALLDIFASKVPPSGAGECCAPKLLQYAYQHGLRPLCMGEFWAGPSPKGEIRESMHFYPACQHKCKPILGWMMKGLMVEENPLMKDYAHIVEQLRIVHEEREFVVVDKPSGMLSVPGKDELPSLLDIMREQYPDAEGPMIVHRLDMDTSGLMVMALTSEAYHALQDQFIHHVIKKRYSALLENVMTIGTEGRIDLPLCPNPYDRPRQMVHEKYGRRAITRYKVVGERNGHTLVNLWPETGRTHQLRVHMAHPWGLNNPIVGDRLYGHAGERLMLFADQLTFLHPTTKEPQTFTLPFLWSEA